jgi:hypothetical protein
MKGELDAPSQRKRKRKRKHKHKHKHKADLPAEAQARRNAIKNGVSVGVVRPDSACWILREAEDDFLPRRQLLFGQPAPLACPRQVWPSSYRSCQLSATPLFNSGLPGE